MSDRKSSGSVLSVAVVAAVLMVTTLSGVVAATNWTTQAPNYQHYWAGFKYQGSGSVAWVEADMTIPGSPPDFIPGVGSDLYSPMMSIWDNNDAYDQLGYTSNGGQWSVAWSIVGHCYDVVNYPYVRGTDYDFGTGTVFLQLSTTYHFLIDITPAGVVTVTVSLQGSTVYTHSKYTGGNAFYLGTHTCGGSNRSPYTLYEEMESGYEVELPEYRFDFLHNSAQGTTLASWSWYTFGGGPVGPSELNQPGPFAQIGTGSDAGSVWIWNQWYTLTRVSPDVSAPRGAVIGAWWDVDTNPLGFHTIGCTSYCEVDLEKDGDPGHWPSGWGDPTFTPSGANPYFRAGMSVAIPSTAALGTYQLVVKADTPSGYSQTKAVLWVTVTSSGGGGGCVAKDTPILTPSGYVAVQDLSPGDVVLGYDLQNRSIVNETLLANNWTHARNLIDINKGSLVVTAENQPLWTWSAATNIISWVRDPQNLSVGDYLFNPVQGNWVPITHLGSVTQNAKVYDVVADGPNTFIANGILADVKQP